MRAVWLVALAFGFRCGPAIAGDMPARPAAGVEQFMQLHAGSVQIVTFPNRHAPPVKVIRGPAPDEVAPAAAGSADKVEIVNFDDPRFRPVTVIRGAVVAGSDVDPLGPAGKADLDLVAFAVDGAESSHGTDLRMWRPDPRGPEGPMQVSQAAALDVGGGDRFDLDQNRLLGRAYLAQLYRRYGNWSDAVAAYNWGPGNLDAWIAASRPPLGLPLEVERYRDRVLRQVGFRQSVGAWFQSVLPPIGKPARKPAQPGF